MCWFDKAHHLTLYVDVRESTKGHISLRPNHHVSPDDIQDFRSLPYPDRSFKLVLFDPPHMVVRNGKEGLMAKKYGSLNNKTWREELARGFSECWRVLDVFGTLVFKWSSCEIPLKEVLACFSEAPLFGHTTNKHGSTHWLCFFKDRSGVI